MKLRPFILEGQGRDESEPPKCELRAALELLH